MGGVGGVGCATVRVSDPPRTADEQFLQSEAVREAIAQLSFTPLRDREVYVETRYLFQETNESFEPAPEYERLFLVAELRNRMLIEGVALTEDAEAAEIILEVRSGAVGINRSEFLLGFPGVSAQVGTVDVGDVEAPVILPELAIVKNRRQRGFAAVSITAYWRDTGELVASSGPFIGRTMRADYWFFGIGPRTTGDVPTTEADE